MNHTNHKNGAASFYIIAVSTLIMVIMATSFATAIIAAINRSSNDELAQSAYDSALAGIEEAKLAYANYRNCINIDPSLKTKDTKEPDYTSKEITCEDIVYWVQHPDCYMVAHILGRFDDKDIEKEVNLEAYFKDDQKLSQAYTCVKFSVTESSIADVLDSSHPYKVLKLTGDTKKVDKNSGLPAVVSSIDSITLKWHYIENGDFIGNDYNINNQNSENSENSEVAFRPRSVTDQDTGLTVAYPSPATIAFQIIQAPEDGFTFDDLNSAASDDGEKTNRATMFFVPTSDKKIARKEDANSYIGAYSDDDKTNHLTAAQVAGTNNRSANKPFVVYCGDESGEEFACSVAIDLPTPKGSEKRNDNVLYFVTSLVYGTPDTIYSLDLNCSNGKICNFVNQYHQEDDQGDENKKSIPIDTDIVVIDSTGRAGDMYKRIETYLTTEVASSINGFPYFAIQAGAIVKDSD